LIGEIDTVFFGGKMGIKTNGPNLAKFMIFKEVCHCLRWMRERILESELDNVSAAG
jgi:hypothetical protein